MMMVDGGKCLLRLLRSLQSPLAIDHRAHKEAPGRGFARFCARTPAQRAAHAQPLFI
jgi:hypothetical protein